MEPDEFRAWLEARPEETLREEALVLASRAALRLLPFCSEIFTSDSERRRSSLNLTFQGFRALLISSGACSWSPDDVSKAAYNAYAGVSAAADVTFAKDYAAGADFASDVAAYAVYAAAHSSGVAYTAFDAITNYANTDLEYDIEILGRRLGAAELRAFKLWADAPPEEFAQGWRHLRNHLSTNLAFSFWIRWYEAMRDGVPQNWDMLKEIALIDPKIWGGEDGPERVAEWIAEIEAKYAESEAQDETALEQAHRLEEATRLEERVEFNPETSRLRVVPALRSDEPLLSDLLLQMEMMFDIVLAAPSNGLREDMPLTMLVRRAHENFADNPQQLEMTLTNAAKIMRRMLDETEDLPNSAENRAALEAIEDSARGVRMLYPAVAENRSRMAGQHLRELPESDRQKISESVPEFAAIFDAPDVQKIVAEAQVITAAWPDGDAPAINAYWPDGDAPPLPGMDANTRFFHRAAQTSILLQTSDIIHKIDGSAGYKAIKIGTTLAGVVTIGLAIYGVL